MSFIGVGGEDWVELDLDLFDRQRLSRVRRLLEEDKPRIAAALGVDYEIEFDEVGNAFLVVDGVRRFEAEVTSGDRLIVSGILDPDGPL